MTRRKKSEERGPVTVWPRAMPDEIGSIPPVESGMSVDADDIGSQFLKDAIEQQLSEWPREPDTGEFALEDQDGSFDGLDEDAFEADPKGWERRITESLRVGKLRTLLPPAEPVNTNKRGSLLPPKRSTLLPPKRSSLMPPAEPLRAPKERTFDWDEMDLTDESIHEASLLDHEGAEWGEVESPELHTEDTHAHGRPRRHRR